MIVEAVSGLVPTVIVGIDPGETTGVCVLELAATGRGISGRIQNGKAWGYEFPVERHVGGFIVAESVFVRQMWERLIKLRISPTFGAPLLRSEVVHLVIEDFILREHNKGRSLLAPVRLISGLAALLDLDDRCWSLHLQQPGDAKSAVTDGTLKQMEMYWVGMQHARDAARHAILYARKFG